MIEDRAPDHLTPIAPAEAVHELCDRLFALGLSYGVRLELRAFRETRTPHDGRRLANALRHVERLPDVAGKIEQLLEGAVARLKHP